MRSEVQGPTHRTEANHRGVEVAFIIITIIIITRGKPLGGTKITEITKFVW